MAEPRRQEEQLYNTDPGEIQNDNANRYESDLEIQNRPQLVEDAYRDRSFNNRNVQSPSRTSDALQNADLPTSLFSSADIDDLRMRWGKVQTSFVDEPRWAVQEADKLVATATERLTERFANERSTMEKQWDRGDDVSTEDLRLALQRYRTFFDRLLNV